MCIWRAHTYFRASMPSRIHTVFALGIIMSLTLAFTCFAAHAPSRAYGILPTHVPTMRPLEYGHLFVCALCVVRVSL